MLMTYVPLHMHHQLVVHRRPCQQKREDLCFEDIACLLPTVVGIVTSWDIACPGEMQQ